MNISLLFLENILKNKLKIETSKSDLDEFGNPLSSGSIEFELLDKDNRLWGGRLVDMTGSFELVEFFPKLFFSDVSYDDLIKESKNFDMTKQKFDDFVDFMD